MNDSLQTSLILKCSIWMHFLMRILQSSQALMIIDIQITQFLLLLYDYFIIIFASIITYVSFLYVESWFNTYEYLTIEYITSLPVIITNCLIIFLYMYIQKLLRKMRIPRDTSIWSETSFLPPYWKFPFKMPKQ